MKKRHYEQVELLPRALPYKFHVSRIKSVEGICCNLRKSVMWSGPT
ncbi:Protein of unknown function [Gryllus bimaculatus]|nr:Protein of unknown function [Gryllus bimaculatus]